MKSIDMTGFTGGGQPAIKLLSAIYPNLIRTHLRLRKFL